MANASSVIGPAERGSYCYGGIITPLGLRRDGAGGAPDCLAPNDRSGLGERILDEHRWMRAIFARKPGKLNEWRQDLRINLRCDVSNG
jgi:hypothetical protein